MSEARRRLLDTATRLFYGEGIHTVGIDRIIAEAGIAKATFYHHFKAKDDLVVAYLAKEYQRQQEALEAVPGAGAAKIEAIFELLGKLSDAPNFRGCPFLNAAAEFADPAHPVRDVVADYRSWFRSLMRTLLKEAGHPDPRSAADFLLVLRDGITISGGLNDMPAVRSAISVALATL